MLLLSDESFDRVISVNLKGVFNAMKHACKAMERSGEGGVVISTASTAALCGGGRDAATPAYTAAKGGVVAMTRSLAVEYGIHNIRVNAVAPGAVRTNLGDDSNTFSLSEMSSEMERDIAAKLPHPGMVRFKPDQSGLRCLRRPLKQAMVLSRSRRRA